MINVLVFPCGSEIGLEVNRALRFDKHIRLYGLSSVPCHGSFVYRDYREGISFIDADTFIDELNEIIDELNIDILIPAYDDVILYVSENREKIRCKLMVADAVTCRICRSKKKTYDFFAGEDFVPQVFGDGMDSPLSYPLFAKPDIGQGSQGIKLIETYEDYDKVEKDAYVICEYLPGKEITVDCFTDGDGNLLVVSPRIRKQVKNGISVMTELIEVDESIRSIVERVNRRLRFNGVWFIQLKEDGNGNYKLLEIAPRVAGSMSISRVRGFNYVLNTVYQIMGIPVKAVPWLLTALEESRALSTVYDLRINYDYVYVDYDDTLIVNEQVNTLLVSFLYQSLNQKKEVILLTRHSMDLMDSLRKYHIDKSIFSEIIHIANQTPKSEYIMQKNSILIDDSFRERLDVSSKLGIPVFDLDAVECLLDHRG